MSVRRCLLPTLALALVGWGGNVVVESGSSGSGAGSGQRRCEEYCAEAADCPEGVPDCASSCELARESFVQQGCGAEFEQYLACFVDSPEVCTATGEECPGDVDAFSA